MIYIHFSYILNVKQLYCVWPGQLVCENNKTCIATTIDSSQFRENSIYFSLFYIG